MKKLTLNFIVSLFYLIGSLGCLTLALQLPRSSSVTAFGGPGTFPVAIMGVIVLLSAYLVVQEIIKPSESSKLEKDDLKRILIMLAVCTLYVFVLETVGYIVSTACLIALLLWLFGFRNKIAFVILTIGFPCFIFVVFQMLLKIQLP